MIVKLMIALLIFCAGFTLGQGHALFDYNGDGATNLADLKSATDKLTKIY